MVESKKTTKNNMPNYFKPSNRDLEIKDNLDGLLTASNIYANPNELTLILVSDSIDRNRLTKNIDIMKNLRRTTSQPIKNDINNVVEIDMIDDDTIDYYSPKIRKICDNIFIDDTSSSPKYLYKLVLHCKNIKNITQFLQKLNELISTIDSINYLFKLELKYVYSLDGNNIQTMLDMSTNQIIICSFRELSIMEILSINNMSHNISYIIPKNDEIHLASSNASSSIKVYNSYYTLSISSSYVEQDSCLNSFTIKNSFHIDKSILSATSSSQITYEYVSSHCHTPAPTAYENVSSHCHSSSLGDNIKYINVSDMTDTYYTNCIEKICRYNLCNSMNHTTGEMDSAGELYAVRNKLDTTGDLYDVRNKLDSTGDLYDVRNRVDTPSNLHKLHNKMDSTGNLCDVRNKLDSAGDLCDVRNKVDTTCDLYDVRNKLDSAGDLYDVRNKVNTTCDLYDVHNKLDATGDLCDVQNKADTTSDLYDVHNKMDSTGDLYDVRNKIGQGNFATVYKITQNSYSNIYLAMKLIAPNILIKYKEMIIRELTIIKKLSDLQRDKKCNNIISFIGMYWSNRKGIGMVFEYGDLGDLYNWITQIIGNNTTPIIPCLSEKFSANILHQILCATHFLHKNLIIHRDIKLENILLCTNSMNIIPIAKLCDFGLSIQITLPNVTNTNSNRLITGICGTPYYISPEMLLNKKYGFAIDIWAIGITLFIMLTGYPPFYSDNDDQNEIFQNIINNNIDFSQEYLSNITIRAQCLVYSLLCNDPDLRININDALNHVWFRENL